RRGSAGVGEEHLADRLWPPGDLRSGQRDALLGKSGGEGGERRRSWAGGERAPAGGQQGDDARLNEGALTCAGWADDREQRLHAKAIGEGFRFPFSPEEIPAVAAGEGRQAQVGGPLVRRASGSVPGEIRQVLLTPVPQGLVVSLEPERNRN